MSADDTAPSGDIGSGSARDLYRIHSGRAAICPTCNRVVRVTTPRGDGSVRRFVTHGPRKNPCVESREWAPGWGLRW